MERFGLSEAGPGHPGHAAAPPGRARTPEDRGRVPDRSRSASPSWKTCWLTPQEDPGPDPRRHERAGREVRRPAPHAHRTRRTEEFREEDLVPDEAVLISITERGYIKRVPPRPTARQGRGGKGVTAMTMRDEDEVEHLFCRRLARHASCSFPTGARSTQERAYQIPDAGRGAKGIPLIKCPGARPGETITAAVAVPSFRAEPRYCSMVTRTGAHQARAGSPPSRRCGPRGLIAITLEEDDQLRWVKLTSRRRQDLILVTRHGPGDPLQRAPSAPDGPRRRPACAPSAAPARVTGGRHGRHHRSPGGCCWS
jgi:hypothetical protein